MFSGSYTLKRYLKSQAVIYTRELIGMNKQSVYETNSFYWDIKGNDLLKATVLPFYGAFVSEENASFLAISQVRRC